MGPKKQRSGSAYRFIIFSQAGVLSATGSLGGLDAGLANAQVCCAREVAD
jgi:hypothetical protein